MAHGRQTALTLTLNLPPEARQTLLAWQRSTTMPAGPARRGRMIVLVAEGMSLCHSAALVGSSRRFLSTWAKRFSTRGWRASLPSLVVAPGDTQRRTPTPPGKLGEGNKFGSCSKSGERRRWMSHGPTARRVTPLAP